MVDAAVILAGGSGRRLGGVDKPALSIAGSTLLEHALAAVGGAVTVVVGPIRTLPTAIRQIQERPSGSGPAAALAAGLAELTGLDDEAAVAVLAADLPAINPDTVDRLAAAVAAGSGAVLVDPAGRRQYLTGVFRLGSLRAAATGDWTGRRLAELLDPLITTVVPATAEESADIDAPDDLERWRDR